MIAPLGGIALLLVIIGVFSVMAYTVALQTHEFGIFAWRLAPNRLKSW